MNVIFQLSKKLGEKHLNRFFDQVVECRSGCWEWSGTRSSKQSGRDYGKVSILGTTFMTHRLMWMLQYEQPIPKGMVIRHVCDNPPCCNPSHLIIGTDADNTKDAFDRGRRKPFRLMLGEDSYSSKLTEAAVREIRMSSDATKTLAKKFNVQEITIRNVRKRKSWKHVPETPLSAFAARIVAWKEKAKGAP